jgi:SM-20-related protein
VRKVVRQTPSAETVQYVQQRLLECKREVEEHFSISLSESEEPQFLRYRVGDFFVAHQDGNTGLMRMDSEARRVSVVIFLNEQSDAPQKCTYCGGSTRFSRLAWQPRERGVTAGIPARNIRRFPFRNDA